MVVAASFFSRSTTRLAKDLLGTYLAHDSPQGLTIGKIVETEAYLFRGDLACHAAKGQTKRNAAMFGPAGVAYVYLIYGIHLCFNVVSGKVGEGEAVLIRALEPIEGIELMKKRRNTDNERMLCNGPGKLVQAMGISREHNAACRRSGDLRILPPESFAAKNEKVRKPSIVTTTRIGINVAQDLALRFYIKGSKFVSKT